MRQKKKSQKKQLDISGIDGEVTTAPTTTSTGVKTFTCLTCGETKTEEIAKLPEESKPSKPADTTTEGKKDDTKPSTDKKEDTQPSTDKNTVVNPTKPAKKQLKLVQNLL